MSHIHLPDGVLPLWLWVGGYLVSALLVALLWKWQRQGTDTRRFALLGVFAALMILVMTIEIPPFGAHANLTIVASIMLGPPLAIIAACIVNLFLAFFGHGGITVVGLNTLVMAVEMLAGYGIFRLLLRLRAPLMLAAFLAVVIGLGLGTTASFGIIALGRPAINQSLRVQASTHTEHEVIDTASTGGNLDLGRLALLMFGVGAIGWVLEGILSTAILVALNRVYPNLVIREE